MEIAKRQEIERKIVDAVVSAAIMNGYMVKVMYDEETSGTAKECDRDTIMKALFACDEEYLYFYTGTGPGSKYLGHVYLVYGNDGYDVICDHSSNDIINGLVKYGEAVAERLQGLEPDPAPDAVMQMQRAQEAPVPSAVHDLSGFLPKSYPAWRYNIVDAKLEGDFSVRVTFTSCNMAGVFEREMKKPVDRSRLPAQLAKSPIQNRLERLPVAEANRLLGQMEGFELALRIIRNRANDRTKIMNDAARKDVSKLGQFDQGIYELANATSAVRAVMVEIGAGRMDVGPFTDDELDEIMRIF